MHPATRSSKRPNGTWRVYALVNHTQRHIVIGVSDQNGKAFARRCAGQVRATNGWTPRSDQIEARLVVHMSNESKADGLAAALAEAQWVPGLPRYAVWRGN